MTPTSTSQPLGSIVADRPAAARVLDRVGLDYCCRGARTLAAACAAAGLDAGDVAAEIDSLVDDGRVDWPSMTPVELADHIVATHHAFLHEELPLLEALAAKVSTVHGKRHPELVEVEALVRALGADLEPHMAKEERVLFPAVHALFEGRTEFPFGSVANPIRVMMAEHDRAGELLAELRRVTNGFVVPEDGCGSYRSLYDRLVELDHDTHVHIHKENHVLFPAVLREELGSSTLEHEEAADHG